MHQDRIQILSDELSIMDKSELMEWQIPINLLQSIDLPTFPIDCLPPSLSKYILAVAEATQTPIDMGAVAALAIVALCVQGKFKIKGKPDWAEPLNLYMVIAMMPGERKSAILRLFSECVEESEAE